MNRKLYALLAVLVLGSMVLSACGGGGQASSKTITIAYTQEPDNIVSEYSNMTYSAWLDQVVGASLLTWDANNNLVAQLAAEVPSAANGDVSADGLTVTFKLKPNLKWSDGQPLTSKDVLFTWQSQMDPKNAPISRSGYDHISSIDTPNDTTAVIHFSSVAAEWPTLFSVGPNTTGMLLPAHILQGQTGLEKNAEIHKPTVVAGAFMIKEWVAGDHMTLVANPNYYGAKPKIGQMNFKFVPDTTTALAALKTGDVDFVPDFAESDIPTLGALEPKQHLRVDTTPEFEHMIFNLGITNSTQKDDKGNVVGNSDQPGFCPFQDVNVRKAIYLAIDRDTIVKTLLFGKTTAPTSLWPNSSWYNTSLTPYPYDPKQAAQLLDAAGYPVGPDGIRTGTCNGQPVKFSISLETTVKQLRQDEQAAIQANLKQVGIDVKTIATPSGTFFGAYTDGANMATLVSSTWPFTPPASIPIQIRLAVSRARTFPVRPIRVVTTIITTATRPARWISSSFRALLLRIRRHASQFTMRSRSTNTTTHYSSRCMHVRMSMVILLVSSSHPVPASAVGDVICPTGMSPNKLVG
jgi:peptide/nickel transport system substrate-binding protein